MSQFTYKVRDKQGRISHGVREAATEEELIAQLQKQELFVVSITRGEQAGKRQVAAVAVHHGVTTDDLIIFSRQLATILGAGVTLLKSLDVLTKQIESKVLLQAIEDVKHNIAGGSSFHDALTRHPKIFNEFWLHIVETGEASGALPLTLMQLADFLESKAAMRRKVTSALVYPAVLVVLVIVALLIFTVWIIPIFSRIFAGFDVELPALTRMVIASSAFMRKYILIVLALFGVGGWLLKRYIRTGRGKWQFDWVVLRLPILSSLYQRIAIERFATGLGTLIESGVPILYGLDIVGKGIGNEVISKAVLDVRESVRQGKGMARPLEESGVFTPLAVQMVAVGEEVGELGKMLKKISEFYKDRIATTLTTITTLIEPVVLVFMGIVVGTMVVAMFLPIFQLATAARGG
jgi:type IV pilus assembly protein PilC